MGEPVFMVEIAKSSSVLTLQPGKLRFKSHLYQKLAWCLWASYLTSLSLRFLICKKEIIIVPSSKFL